MVLLMKPRATSRSEEYSGDVRSAAFGSRFIILFRLAFRFCKAMARIEAPTSTRAFARNVKQRNTPPFGQIGQGPESAVKQSHSLISFRQPALPGVLSRPSEQSEPRCRPVCRVAPCHSQSGLARLARPSMFRHSKRKHPPMSRRQERIAKARRAA